MEWAAVVGLGLIVVFVLTAFLAPLIAPHDPLALGLGQQLKPPSLNYPLGTDELGRDLFSRLLWGARYTLLITLGAVALAVILGTVSGVYSGLP